MKKEESTGYTEQITYKLTRDQLIRLYHQFDCEVWKKTITTIIRGTELCTGDKKITIAVNHIDLLNQKGTIEQKKAVEALGIKLVEDKSVYIKDSPTMFSQENSFLVAKRTIGEYAQKSFQLCGGFNWEIKKDDLGDLCLIPTKK